MARILIASELGKGYEYASRCGAVIDGLLNNGHHVTFTSRKLEPIEHCFIDESVEWHLAPKIRTKGHRNKPPCSYAELLLESGLSDSQALGIAIRKWHQLIKKTKPDVVVLDHSPTLALALMSYGAKTIPYFHIGSSFTLPPLVEPLPKYLQHDDVHPDRLHYAERTLLKNINDALAATGTFRLIDIRDIFTDYDVHTTWEDLDPFSVITKREYIGPIYHRSAGSIMQWKDSDDKKIFCHIDAKNEATSTLLTALASLNADVICSINVDDRYLGVLRALFKPSQIKLTNHPVSMANLLPRMDLFVGNGGPSLTSHIAMHGIPTIVLPSSTEHQLLCSVAGGESFQTMDSKLGIHSMRAQIATAARLGREKNPMDALGTKFNNYPVGASVNAVIRIAEQLHKEYATS